MKKIKLFLSVAVVTFMFAACSKEGDKGATGAQGPAGPQGPVGQTGAANVKSYIFTNANTLDFKDGDFDRITLTFGGAFDVPLDTRDNGVLLVYALFDNGNADFWEQLPNYIPSGDFNVVTTITPTALLLQARTNSMGILPGDASVNPIKIKVIAIPPGTTPTTIGKVALPDYNNYEETMKYYGLSID